MGGKKCEKGRLVATWYDIYCDESDTNGNNRFWIGALMCSPERVRIIEERIYELRKKYAFDSEFKWTKLKSHNFHIYSEFVDVFIRITTLD